MVRINVIAAIAAMALLASCATLRMKSTAPSPGRRIASGAVTHLSSAHGNAYTSIHPDQYEALGLEPGKTIRVAFDHAALTLVIGRTYTDAPSGEPLAVLHREGFTFAIRDGNFSATHGIKVGAQFSLWNIPRE